MDHVRFTLLGVCASVFAFFAATAHLGCRQQAVEPPPEPIRPVRYVKVEAGGGGRVHTFAGTAKAGVESNLSFKVGGTVERLAVKVGDRVHEGELLASLDPKDFELQVQQAEASLSRSRAEARNASHNYDRVRQLYEDGNASRNDLDGARAAAESAAAAVRAADKQLQLSKRQLTYTRLQAPFPCAVAGVEVEERENVRGGQTIVQVAGGERWEVEVAVPEGLIATIRRGDEVSVRFDALSGRVFVAVVDEVGISMGGATTTYPVTVQLAEGDPRIRPGMAAEVIFRPGGNGEGEIIMVPAVAVGEDRDGHYLFVVEPLEGGLGVAHRRPVEVGDLVGSGLAIAAGVSAGELVVTAGVSRITDGQTVRLPQR